MSKQIDMCTMCVSYENGDFLQSSIEPSGLSSIRGTKYKEDDFVLWKFDGEMPIFAKIIAIIIPELSEPKFVIFPLVTVAFSSHFHAYKVVYRLSLFLL